MKFAREHRPIQPTANDRIGWFPVLAITGIPSRLQSTIRGETSSVVAGSTATGT
jgi:hypothetical protein